MSRVPRLIALALALLTTARAAPPLLSQREEPEPVTKILIQGTRTMTSAEAFDLVEGRLEYVLSQPATRARAADAAFLVERLFRTKGFRDASVSWSIPKPNLIRLRVDEGTREALGEVRIEGVPDEDRNEELARLFELPMRKRVDGGGIRPPIGTGDVEAGLELIRRQLKSFGLYGAEVEVAERRETPETGHVDFVIDVDPGRIFKIATPSFEGEVADAVRRAANVRVGEPATTANVNETRLAVSEYYRARGFVDAKVRMRIEVITRSVVPQFEVVQGRRFRLGEVDFTGLERTNPERVAVRLRDLEGKFLDGETTERRISQLIATGAFSSVRIERREREDGTLDATLHFEEAEAKGVSFTAGFDSYEGPLFGSRYYDRNFLGRILNLTAGFEISGRSILGEVSIADPWIRGTDLSGSLRLYSLRRSNEGYIAWRSGLEGILTWPVTEHYQIDFAAGVAYVVTEEDGLPPATLGDTDYQNPYLRINQRLDYRDSAVLPTEGWHLDWPLEIGSTIGDMSIGYLKTGLEGSYRQPLGSSGQLGIGLRGGVLIPSGDSADLPIDIRYFNGGSRSVRSFPDRELGPRSVTGFPTGGEAYWVGNIEYVRQVAGPLRLAAFIDAGGLSADWEEFGFDEVELAAGLGIRLNLPIGPVRLEYGHNLTQDPGEPSGTWHFAIGTTF